MNSSGFFSDSDGEFVTGWLKECTFNVDVDFSVFRAFVSKEVPGVEYVFGAVIFHPGLPIVESVEGRSYLPSLRMVDDSDLNKLMSVPRHQRETLTDRHE